MNSAREALRPILILASACGVQMFEYRIFTLNYIHYLILWSTYAITFTAVYFWTNFHTLFNNWVYSSVLSLNAFTSMMATGLTLQHKKKFQHCLEGLAIVNTSLRQINIPDEYSKLHNLTCKAIGIWILVSIYFFTADTGWAFEFFGKGTGTLIVVIVNYPNLINFLTFTIIYLVLSYIDSRFGRINEHVVVLINQNNKEHNNKRTNWMFKWRCQDVLNPVKVTKQERAIWIIMLVHNDLCKISRNLNTLFSLQVTLELGSYFMYMTGFIIYICTMQIPEYRTLLRSGWQVLKLLFQVLMVASWCGVYLARLIYINYVCESICAKANSTRILVHNFLNDMNGVQLRKEMLQFILHTVNRPLRFDGAGMFYFGYGFIYTFFNAMSTVTVIILQSVDFGDSSKYKKNSTSVDGV